MKSILLAVYSRLGRSFSKSVTTISKNSMSGSSTLSKKSDNNIFLVSYLSTLMYSIFEFIQKNTAYVYGQMKLSQSNRFKVNALGVLTLVLFFGVNEMKGQTYYAMSGGNYSQTFTNLSTSYPTNFNGFM